MTYNEYLKTNYEDLLKAAQTITGSNNIGCELLHHIIIYFSNREEKTQISIDNGYIKWSMIKAMSTEWKSKTSPFYRKVMVNLNHRSEAYNNNEYLDYCAVQADMIVDDNDEPDEYTKRNLVSIKDILQIIFGHDDINDRDKKVFIHYFIKGQKINEIVETTKISKFCAYSSIRKIRRIIREEIL